MAGPMDIIFSNNILLNKEPIGRRFCCGSNKHQLTHSARTMKHFDKQKKCTQKKMMKLFFSNHTQTENAINRMRNGQRKTHNLTNKSICYKRLSVYVWCLVKNSLNFPIMMSKFFTFFLHHKILNRKLFPHTHSRMAESELCAFVLLLQSILLEFQRISHILTTLFPMWMQFCGIILKESVN